MAAAVAWQAERLAHAHALVVRLALGGDGEAVRSLCMELREAVLEIDLGLSTIDGEQHVDRGRALVRVPRDDDATPDLGSARVSRVGAQHWTVHIPFVREGTQALVQVPTDAAAVRERTRFDLRAADMRRRVRKCSAASTQLCCSACDAVIVPECIGPVHELPRMPAHELADITCACEGESCAWDRMFLPAADLPAADAPPAPEAAAVAAEAEAPRRLSSAGSRGRGAASRLPSPADDAPAHPVRARGGTGVRDRVRESGGGAFGCEAWVLLRAERCTPAALHYAEGEEGRPGGGTQRASLVFRGRTPAAHWSHGLRRPQSSQAARARKRARPTGVRSAAPPLPAEQRWALCRCAACGWVLGAAQLPARVTDSIAEATACILGPSAADSSPAPLQLPAPAPPSLRAPDRAGLLPADPPASHALERGAEARTDAPPFAWFEPELTAFTHDALHVQLLAWRVERALPGPASARAAAEASSSLAPTAVGAIGAALLRASEEAGVGHFELLPAGDESDRPVHLRRARSAAQPGAAPAGRVLVQLLSAYCRLCDGCSEGAAGRGGEGSARGGCAPESAWRDALKVLYAIDAPEAEGSTAGPPQPSTEPGSASAGWGARAGGVRRLRVLDADLCSLVRTLERSNGVLPRGERHINGLAIGHIDVSPFLA